MSDCAPLPPPVADLLQALCRRICALPWANTIVLYGSYAKGSYSVDSDVDIAVFAKPGVACGLQEYRQLASICRTDVADVQAQAFSADELTDPCGIVEEILEFGIDITNFAT